MLILWFMRQCCNTIMGNSIKCSSCETLGEKLNGREKAAKEMSNFGKISNLPKKKTISLIDFRKPMMGFFLWHIRTSVNSLPKLTFACFKTKQTIFQKISTPIGKMDQFLLLKLRPEDNIFLNFIKRELGEKILRGWKKVFADQLYWWLGKRIKTTNLLMESSNTTMKIQHWIRT